MMCGGLLTCRFSDGSRISGFFMLVHRLPQPDRSLVDQMACIAYLVVQRAVDRYCRVAAPCLIPHIFSCDFQGFQFLRCHGMLPFSSINSISLSLTLSIAPSSREYSPCLTIWISTWPSSKTSSTTASSKSEPVNILLLPAAPRTWSPILISLFAVSASFALCPPRQSAGPHASRPRRLR